MEKYYIPDISEFKHGFKFEYLVIAKGDEIFRIYNFTTEKIEDVYYAKKDRWAKVTVYWDVEPSWKTLKYNDITIHYIDKPEFFYNIETLIKNGTVRAKLKNKWKTR